MTEIQWLCDILLNYKMPKEVKDKFISRIGEVEAQLSKPQIMVPRPNSIGVPIQAPSTQRLMDEQPFIPPVIKPSPSEIDRETGKPMISTGNGTKGPRKW